MPMPRTTSFLIALVALTACVSVRTHTPASLAESRRLVRVTYAAPQTLLARAAGRDSMMHRVTAVVGWPTVVRGDTLHLQLARWRAEGHMYTMPSPDYTVIVLPEAGAAIRDDHAGDTGSLTTVLAVFGSIVAYLTAVLSL